MKVEIDKNQYMLVFNIVHKILAIKISRFHKILVEVANKQPLIFLSERYISIYIIVNTDYLNITYSI